jgi:hypothetical protein
LEWCLYTLPLVVISQKQRIQAHPRSDKMKNPFFVAAHKTIVAKVVGNGDMHSTDKIWGKDLKVPLLKRQNPSSFPLNSINHLRGRSLL